VEGTAEETEILWSWVDGPGTATGRTRTSFSPRGSPMRPVVDAAAFECQ